jgi:hypothetical protein
MFRRCIPVCLLALAAVCLNVSQASACPMCKMALETDDPAPRAYMMSILFMMGMIGGIFAGMIGFLYWLSRNERAALDAAGYQHLFENGVSEHAANPGA